MAKKPARPKPGRRSPTPAVLLVLLLGAAAGAWVWWPSGELMIDERTQAFMDWAKAGGAVLPGAAVGRPCATCRRGVYATKNLKEGELILTIPGSLLLSFSGNSETSAMKARDVLTNMHLSSTFNKTWGPYWDSLPPPEETFAPELLSDEQIQLLQHPHLIHVAQSRRSYAEGVWQGDGGEKKPLAAVLPEGSASADTLKYIAALILTRAMTARVDGQPATALLPLADLINHSHQPNAKITGKDGINNLHALRAIRKGEEIVHDYKNPNLYRPDTSLFSYGFTPPTDTPLLCAVDLPEGFTGATDDALYEDPAQGYVTQAEHDRLAALLARAPSSEAEDEALLASGVHTDWRDQTIIRMRVLCKRALRLTVAKLAAALQHGGKAEL